MQREKDEHIYSKKGLKDRKFEDTLADLARYKMLSENTRDIILFISENGEIIEANHAAVKAYGYTQEELQHLDIFKIRKDWKFIKDQMLEADSGVIFETEHYKKDGTSFPVEVSSQGTVINGKKILLSIIRDISERKKAESLLLESEIRYRSLFINLRSGFAYHKAIYNEEGSLIDFEFVLINDAYAKLFNVNKESICGKLFSEVFPHGKGLFERHKNAYVEVLFKGKDLFYDEEYLEPFGKWFSIAMYSPEKGYFAIVLTDIDQKKKSSIELERAKEAAEKANKSKGEFLANISHEIRTPLNGILGMIDLTLLTELNDEQAENLKTAKGCANSLLRIINDILDFSKIEACKLIIEKVDFDIKSLLDEIVKAHSLTATEKGLKLLFDITENIPQFIVGDPNRIRQILNNLISNAIKFTEFGEISIEVIMKNNQNGMIELQFSVKDTGIGIASKNLNNLFKSFSQIDGSYTRKYGGTGLGLVISKQLVEMMRGEMWVESIEGEGSNFSFSLPLMIGKQPIPNRVMGYMIESSINNINILIVEDDQVNQLILARTLRKRGHNVDLASNGVEALNAYQLKKYDLILMDIQMPEMDGVETTSHIREIEIMKNKRYTPIIALTAYALHGDREKFLSFGMDEYVSKPISINELYDKIDKVLRQRDNGKESDLEIRITEDGDLVYKKQYVYTANCKKKALEQMEYVITTLDSVIANKSLSVIEGLANQIKKLCIRIDAEELKNTAFRIELSARRGDIEETILKCNQLQKGFLELKETFKIEGEII